MLGKTVSALVVCFIVSGNASGVTTLDIFDIFGNMGGGGQFDGFSDWFNGLDDDVVGGIVPGVGDSVESSDFFEQFMSDIEDQFDQSPSGGQDCDFFDDFWDDLLDGNCGFSWPGIGDGCQWPPCWWHWPCPPCDGNHDGCIPAPGAALLAVLGSGIVGWLRRRRTL